MSFNKKLPVFFHIPKNAGTYVYNASYWTVCNNLSSPEKPWSLEVFKNGKIAYRLICSPKKPEAESKYTKVDAGYWWRVDIDDLDLNDFHLYFLEVCDISFASYKKEIYKKLNSEIQIHEFLVLRSPYERTLSLYSYINSAQSSHEETNKSLGDKSFVEYLNSDQLEGGWLIRSLIKLPNEIPIEEKHYDQACLIIKQMEVINITELDFKLSDIFLNCYGSESSGIKREVFANKTKNKINILFRDLDKNTQEKFSEQTKWDKLLFETYANKKIIDKTQKKGKITNCFYDGADGGFGDFLRGSVHLFNHCGSKNIDFDINIEKHDIKKHFKKLENSCQNFEIDDLAIKSKYEGKQFVHSLKRNTEQLTKTTHQHETKYIFSNYHPCLVDHNDVMKYLNSMPPINNRCCAWFQDKLKFSKKVNDAVNEKLKSEGLVAGKFDVFHFRLGDHNSFSDHGKNLEELYRECLKNCLGNFIDDDKPIVILSDSNDLKSYISKKNNRMPIHILHLKSNHVQKKPSNFSGEIEISDDDLFHAVFDMKLITLANSVESYSVYNHGSGFVYWIAKIFGVPVKLNLITC